METIMQANELSSIQDKFYRRIKFFFQNELCSSKHKK